MKDTFREITGAEISVDLDIVRTDQLYGKTKEEILQQQLSDPEVGILSGSETWDVLKNEQKKFTHKFIQSRRVWSSN